MIDDIVIELNNLINQTNILYNISFKNNRNFVAGDKVICTESCKDRSNKSSFEIGKIYIVSVVSGSSYNSIGLEGYHYWTDSKYFEHYI